MSGPEEKPKSLSGEKAGAEGWIDAGSEAFSSEGAASLIGLEDIVASVADDGEIQRRSVFSGSAVVFVEGEPSPRPIRNRPTRLDIPTRIAYSRFQFMSFSE